MFISREWFATDSDGDGKYSVYASDQEMVSQYVERNESAEAFA